MARCRSTRDREIHGRTRACVHSTLRARKGVARSWLASLRLDAEREERPRAALFRRRGTHSKACTRSKAHMRSAPAYDFHIVVVGGGMVGACTAALLASDP